VDHLVGSIQSPEIAYFYCCFDFDRTTFECFPIPTGQLDGYLRAMLQGFIERLYPYTGDARTLIFLQDFVDYGWRTDGLRGLCLGASSVCIGESRCEALHRLERACEDS